MNTTTENTTKHTSVFDNKEQYLVFRANWKKLYAAGFQKRVKHEYTHSGFYTRNAETGRHEYISGPPGFHMESPLTVFHHLIFNLAIGRNPPDRAFGNYRKAPSWQKPILYWNVKYTKWDFTPFGDTLTPAQIETLKQQADAYIRGL